RIAGFVGSGPVNINTTGSFTSVNSSPGYTGTITLNSGTLTGGGTSGFGVGTLILNGGTVSVGGMNVNNSSILVNNDISLVANSISTINSPISGSGNITKSGASVVIFNGNNTNYTGDFIVNQGSIAGS